MVSSATARRRRHSPKSCRTGATASRRIDEDPFGGQTELPKKKLDETLLNGDPEAAGVVHGAIEDFAQEFASVTRRFLRTKDWADTQKIAVGGGFRNSRIGEVAIGRAAVLLKADGVAIDLVPIKHHPDEAGLLGSVQLLPSWALSGHDGLLAVDIGGTNIRVGIVLTQLAKASDLSAGKVWKSELWRHVNDSPSRDEAVARLNKMLQKLLDAAKDEKLKIAPVIGIGCPGVIEPRWNDRPRRAKSAGRQLGRRKIQPAERNRQSDPDDRRSRYARDHA